LCPGGFRGLLHEDGKGPEANLWVGKSGDKTMTTSTSNRHNGNTDDPIFELGHNLGMTASSALYYPSLAGNHWDDELLPSGD
jgi:hypothetical protein